MSGCASTPDLASIGFSGKENSSIVGRQLSLARLSERHGQEGTAQRIYDHILIEDPSNSVALHRTGVLAARSGRIDQAMEKFQAALAVDSNNAELLADIGYAYYLQDDLPTAEQKLREAIELDQDQKSAHNNLGLVLAQQGRWDESLSHFKSAVGDAEAHANLAFAQSQMGEVDLAETNFHLALDINPKLQTAAEGLVQLDGAVANYDAMIASYQKQQSGEAINVSDAIVTAPNVTNPVIQQMPPSSPSVIQVSHSDSTDQPSEEALIPAVHVPENYVPDVHVAELPDPEPTRIVTEAQVDTLPIVNEQGKEIADSPSTEPNVDQNDGLLVPTRVEKPESTSSGEPEFDFGEFPSSPIPVHIDPEYEDSPASEISPNELSPVSGDVKLPTLEPIGPPAPSKPNSSQGPKTGASTNISG